MEISWCGVAVEITVTAVLGPIPNVETFAARLPPFPVN